MRGEAVARLGDPTVEPAAVVLEPRPCSAGRAATLGVVDETAEMDENEVSRAGHGRPALRLLPFVSMKAGRLSTPMSDS